MKMTAIIFALLTALSVTSAQAKHHRHYKPHKMPAHAIIHIAAGNDTDLSDSRYGWVSQGQIQARTSQEYAYDGGHVVSHPAGCPWRLFCGCGASVRVFGYPVRDLFLAENWRRFPSAMPGAGMVAWRSGHVFVIESVNGDGTVVAYDANSGGHLTRIHTVSLSGFHVVDPHGARVALR